MSQPMDRLSFANAHSSEVGYEVKHWMETPYILMVDNRQLSHVLEMLTLSKGQDLIVISRDHEVEGLITQEKVNELLQSGFALDQKVEDRWIEATTVSFPDDSVLDLPTQQKTLPVVNYDHKLVGTVNSAQILDAYKAFSSSSKHNAEILSVVLETAYEGVAVVDADANIQKMNEAYRNFLGIKPDEDVNGRSVTEVIENTQLHKTVETGIPERGKTQIIQGQKMIVHRIPIWKDNHVIGAIGMLIFEGVTDLYRILENATQIQTAASPAKEIVASGQNRKKYTFENMIGESSALQVSKSKARKAAQTKATVLITGESGTGKEMFAQSIHNMSKREEASFVSINCAAIPEQLLEAELFGYEEGAFTGAKKGGQPGKFEIANGGTLFLDEIGDMPLQMQTKMLRVLEEEEVVRVGGSHFIPLDVRIIAATNQDLAEKIKSGEFREDLYYRLHVIRIQIPPLRNRKADIPDLIEYHVQTAAKKHQVSPKLLEKKAMSALMSYEWPGNIRELVNVVEQLLTLVDTDKIRHQDLPDYLQAHENSIEAGTNLPPIKKERGEHEKAVIEAALAEAEGNKTKAAKQLGIHRTTLYKKIKEYQLQLYCI
ncbi:sigma 54-interacting transcriptional regulator [Salsuginibacillus kocurii]|uniref:sigma 54-interacting transcriptional regulator n=1 Tax=Salsuginibacillus kocurii TaxID=427078 RepID=UPI0003787BA7|nr:sigma 54-interacting transcriptional regulator [Salsuginibacillus kocurii]